MKICIVCLLLFGAVFSLYAQANEGVSLFISPVSGTGSTPEDNGAFTDLLFRELGAQNFNLKKTPLEADYCLFGTLVPVGADSGDAPPGTAARYYLSITLQDKDGLPLYEQGFQYTTIEDGNSYIPTLLFNMLENVFAMEIAAPAVDQEAIDHEAWRNKQWYIGAHAFWNPRIYYGSTLSTHLANFGLGLSAEFHFQKYAVGKLTFLKYISLGTGLELASEWVVASPRPGDEYRNTLLQIPFSIQGVLKPGDKLFLELYGGVQANIRIFPDTVPALFSWRAGFQPGIKAGEGIAYADLRFSMDFGKSGLRADHPSETRQYDRYMMYLGIGYKYDIVGMIQDFIRSKRTADS
jgi:hypothetical protein